MGRFLSFDDPPIPRSAVDRLGTVAIKGMAGPVQFLKGILLIVGIVLIIWVAQEWSKKLCHGTYCELKFCENPEKIKACEEESLERWKNASPEEKAKVKLLDSLKDK